MIRVPHVLLLIGQPPSSQPLAPVVMRRVAQPLRIFSSLSWPCRPTTHSGCIFLHLKVFCNLTALFSDALDALFRRTSPSAGVWAASSNTCGGARFHFHSLRRDAAKGYAGNIGRYSAARHTACYSRFTVHREKPRFVSKGPTNTVTTAILGISRPTSP